MATLTDFLTGIANAIRGKTGETGTILASQFADKIAGITTGTDTSDATATSSDILEGKTAYVNGSKVTGSIATVTQATPSISVSSSGLITARSTQSAGYVADGTKSTTKQLTTQAAQTITPGTSNQTISSGRYLTGAQTIKGDPNLVASNIVSGVSIFGVSGTAEVSSSTWIDVTITNDSDYDIYAVSGSFCYCVSSGSELPVSVRYKDMLGIFFTNAIRTHSYAQNRVPINETISNPDELYTVGYVCLVKTGTGNAYFRVYS